MTEMASLVELKQGIKRLDFGLAVLCERLDAILKKQDIIQAALLFEDFKRNGRKNGHKNKRKNK